MAVRLSLTAVVAAIGFALALPAEAACPSVRIVSLTPKVSRGHEATLVAAVSPAGASCSLVIYLRSGPSAARGLGSKRATDGRVSWTWSVGRSTTGGTWPVYVECGPAGIAKTAFTVTG